MTAGLKPYPEYKDSGLPWLGKIPAHWSLYPAFSVLREKNLRNTGLVVNDVLSLSYGRIITRDVEKNRGLLPMSFDTYQIVSKGNVVLRLTDLQNDQRSLRVGLAKQRGIITSAYLCLEPQNDLHSEYLYYLLHSLDVQKVFYGMGSGLRQSMGFTDLKRLPIVVPSNTEQRAIAAYLNVHDRRIRSYIRAKQRLIAVLNEQKQAIIHQAVTRGLDPNVRLKPSGVEWLGDVPEGWDIRRLKQSVTPIEQGWSPQCDAQPANDGEWGVLKVGCVNRDHFDASQNKKLPSSLSPVPSLEIRDGDILMSRANTRKLLGLAALAVKPRSQLILCDKLFRFRPLPQHADPRFLVHAIRCGASRAQIEASTK